MWLKLPGTTLAFSPATEALTSPSDSLCQRLAASVSWRGKLLLPRSWRHAWRTEAWRTRLSGLTCEPSQAHCIVAAWLESLADSPAKTSALPEDRTASAATAADSSLTSSDWFASWDQSSGSFLKTSLQSSLFQAEQPYSENLPKSGSMRNGRLYGRPTVGAPHRRDRVFVLAYRTGRKLGILRQPSGGDGLADGGEEAVGNAIESSDQRMQCRFCWYWFDASLGKYGCPNCESVGLAYTSRPRLQRRKLSGPYGAVERSKAHGPTAEFCSALFPPGPADTARWADILADRPDLAPATESEFRGLADGAAARVDRLRAAGNGVVPVQGAAAFVALAGRILAYET